MLSKTIIVEKPVVHMPVVYQGGSTKEKNIKNQYDLDVFLESKPVLGEILAVKSVFGEVKNLYQLHYVARICTDFGELTYDTLGNAKTHFLLQMEFFDNPNPWNRWADILDYRRTTEQEREALGAQLQDRIERIKEFLAAHA